MCGDLQQDDDYGKGFESVIVGAASLPCSTYSLHGLNVYIYMYNICSSTVHSSTHVLLRNDFKSSGGRLLHV